jgi:hypothetical protein
LETLDIRIGGSRVPLGTAWKQVQERCNSFPLADFEVEAPTNGRFSGAEVDLPRHSTPFRRRIKAGPSVLPYKDTDVISCTQCGASLTGPGQYCSMCGSRLASVPQIPSQNGNPRPYFRFQRDASRPNNGFSQNFGLDPRIAGLMLVVDLMLNAGDIVSMGLLVPFSVAAGIVLGYITYKAQMNWYGDDKESAKIKAIVVALLTAIPTPLPAILYVPAGILGVFRNARRKLART